MTPYRALQSCCSRPRLNFVGGVDEGRRPRLRGGIGLPRACRLFQMALRPVRVSARRIGRVVRGFAAFLARAS